MLIRIVRMVFDPAFVADFEAMFNEKRNAIRAYPGCEKLALWRDHTYPNIYYTRSHWQSKAHLDDYRSSDLFKETWAQTKKGFVDRPQAFSTYEVIEVD